MKRCARLVGALWLISALAGCSSIVSRPADAAPGAPGTACVPTDQDQYVYDPHRLEPLQACIYVSGIINRVELAETDGDTNFFLRLDPPYQHLLTQANVQEERGDLVVEAICTSQPLTANAILICDADPDPYAGLFPSVGAHVWMEGRYALDAHHEGHAELHPLYRTGLIGS
jgi:hypothetical protein